MSQSGPIAHQWAGGGGGGNGEDSKPGWNCLPFGWLFHRSPSGSVASNGGGAGGGLGSSNGGALNGSVGVGGGTGRPKLARVLPKSQTFVSVVGTAAGAAATTTPRGGGGTTTTTTTATTTPGGVGREVRLLHGGSSTAVARSLSANDVPTSADKAAAAPVASLCQLCLCVVSLRRCMRLEPCAHMFCVECLEQHAAVCVESGRASVPCPHAHCDLDVRDAQVRALLAASCRPALVDRWRTLQLNEQIARDPLRMFCPGPSCANVCQLPKPAIDPYGLQCSKCRYTFCVVCQDSWHPLKDCDQATILQNLLQDIQGIKRCPHCSVLIEREDGCAQMLCKNCRHVFCWFCLASLDDDFLLRHYDRGPCRHKLGHSRASVMWHRTQVLGIFAGFGFLVLLASPLLILAVPCILGGKCGARCSTCATSGQTDADETANKPPPSPAPL